MCTCIDEIKKEIATVQNESASMLKRASVDVDTFLDAILEMQENLKEINDLSDKLYTLLINNFTRLSSDHVEMFKMDLQPTIKSLDKLYITLRKSKWYSGIKSDLKTMRVNVDNIKEIYNDMIVFKVELPTNDRYRSIIDKLNTL